MKAACRRHQVAGKGLMAVELILAFGTLDIALPRTLGKAHGAGGNGLVSAITVRIYNYARVPVPILVSTEGEANRIFRKAGVETEWVDCRLSVSESRTPDCERPPTTSDVILKLLPPSMAQSIPVGDGTFGITFTAGGKPTTEGFIFYQRVVDLARSGYVHEQEVLAAVMAHEIGHMLLGSSSHSISGVMKSAWNREELELARMGLLRFTPSQSTLIRAEVRARAGQQTASSLWPGNGD